MRLYDLTILLDPNAPEDGQAALLSEVESIISSQGEIAGSYDWGTRRLAYEIDHRPEATYHLFQFNGERELLDRLRERLKIMDGVLRFRIIRNRGEAEPPPPPDRQDRRQRDEREPEGKVAARAAADAPPPG
jgi:small subunit ribosomal protein S6